MKVLRERGREEREKKKDLSPHTLYINNPEKHV